MIQSLPAGALSRLQTELEHLTPALQRAAQYLLEYPEKVIYQSITEVAEGAACAESSVLRLCRELGFKGFQDFKLAVSADLVSKPLNLKNVPQSIRDILWQAQHEMQAVLNETVKIMDTSQLEAAADMLMQARQVVIVGQGASGVTAEDFAYKLLRLGINALIYQDPHLAAMAASNCRADDVVVGISRSGTTIDTVYTLERAKEQGSKTIAVTHRGKSPINRFADISLLSSSAEGPLSGGATPGKVGQLLIIDVLYRTLLWKYAEANEAIHRTATAVSEKNY